MLKADIPDIEIGNPTGSTNLDLQRNSLQAASNTIKACQVFSDIYYVKFYGGVGGGG